MDNTRQAVVVSVDKEDLSVKGFFATKVQCFLELPSLVKEAAAERKASLISSNDVFSTFQPVCFQTSSQKTGRSLKGGLWGTVRNCWKSLLTDQFDEIK